MSGDAAGGRADIPNPYHRTSPPDEFVAAAHRAMCHGIVRRWGRGPHDRLADLARCDGFERIVRCWVIDSPTHAALWARPTVVGARLCSIAWAPDGARSFARAAEDRGRDSSAPARRAPRPSVETLLRRAAVLDGLEPDFYLRLRPARPEPSGTERAAAAVLAERMARRDVERIGRTGTPSPAPFHLRGLVPRLELDGARMFDPEYLRAPGAAIAETLRCLGVEVTTSNVARELRRFSAERINSGRLLPS